MRQSLANNQHVETKVECSTTFLYEEDGYDYFCCCNVYSIRTLNTVEYLFIYNVCFYFTVRTNAIKKEIKITQLSISCLKDISQWNIIILYRT